MSLENDDPPAKRTRSARNASKRPSSTPSPVPTDENNNKHLKDEIQRLEREVEMEKQRNSNLLDDWQYLLETVDDYIQLSTEVNFLKAEDFDRRVTNIERRIELNELLREEGIEKDVEERTKVVIAKERANTAFYRNKMCELMKQMQAEQVAVGGPTPWKHCELCDARFSNTGKKLPVILVGCGHTMCKSCVMKHWKDGSVKCPFDDECNETNVSDVDSLPTNKHILHV